MANANVANLYGDFQRDPEVFLGPSGFWRLGVPQPTTTHFQEMSGFVGPAAAGPHVVDVGSPNVPKRLQDLSESVGRCGSPV